MTYRLWVLIAGLMGYTGCFVWLQDSILRTVLSILCAFVIGVGIVLVGEKFDDLKNEVEGLRKQITQSEKSNE